MANTGKKSDGKGAPLNLRVPPALKLKFKLWCVERGVEMTDVLISCMTDILSGKAKYKKPAPPPPAPRRPR